MKHFIGRAQSWLPIERLSFLLLLTAFISVLFTLTVLEFLDSRWVDIRKEAITRYVGPSKAYSQIAEKPPSYATPYSYLSVHGYYDSRCQDKIESEHPDQHPSLWDMTVPDEKCVLTEYSDTEFVGYETRIYWRLGGLIRNWIFRASIVLFFSSAILFFFYRRLIRPLLRWISEGRL